MATADTGAGALSLSAAYRRYSLTLLFLLYVLNYLDRQIVNILAEKIKLDLNLLDSQLGLLTGFSFALLYAVAGFPIARLAERRDRPIILGVAAAVWSGCTLLCGLAQNFVQLLAARAGVGVGEAGCAPTAFSLISDYTPRSARSSALGLFSMGAPAGALLGLVIGGYIAQNHGWRAAFLICGAPGIALGLLAAVSLREPRRQDPTLRSAPHEATASFRSAAAVILARRSFVLLACGAAINNFLGYGRAAFYAPYFLRSHADDLAALAASMNAGLMTALGLIVGLTIGTAGIAGSYVGGLLGDKLGSRNPRWYGDVPAIAALLNVVTFIVTMMLPLIPALCMLFVASFTNTIWYGSVYNATQSVTPRRSRATAAALLLSFITLVGLALGPLSVGALSDLATQAAGFDSGEGLRIAFVVSAPLGLLGALFFHLGGRRVAAELVE